MRVCDVEARTEGGVEGLRLMDIPEGEQFIQRKTQRKDGAWDIGGS